MAVLLQRHHLVDLERAELDHAADIVAGKVDEHDVLGDFLGVLDELGGQPAVVFLGFAALAGAGDRAANDPVIEQLHHRLR